MIIKKLTLTNNPKSSKYGRLVSEWRRLMATWGPLPPRTPTKSVHPTYEICASASDQYIKCWSKIQTVHSTNKSSSDLHKVCIRPTKCVYPIQKVCIQPSTVCVHSSSTFKSCASDLQEYVHPTYIDLCATRTSILWPALSLNIVICKKFENMISQFV